MWFDGVRQPNTIYVASVSRGKDSTAMLRAIQLMGWPLDAIYSVDIWATQDIPAELPPMVAFKDEWDRKCLDWFGTPVTRCCAVKRERESRKLTANAFGGELATKIFCTGQQLKGNSLEQSRDFQCSVGLGATNSKQVRLTYEDIFYRPMKPRSERERESHAALDRIPNEVVPVLHGRTQESRIYGFPIRKGNWCTSYLKRGAFTLFISRRGQGAENKYCPLYRHSRRRAETHCAAHRQARQGAAAGADRLGRGFVRT